MQSKRNLLASTMVCNKVARIVILLSLIAIAKCSGGDFYYRVGVGRADVTGPAADIIMVSTYLIVFARDVTIK